MRALRAGGAVFSLMLGSAAWACAPAPALAVGCVGCHPATAVSPLPVIQGRPEAELLARLRAFASAPATAPEVMSRMLRGVPDATLQQLAGHFACPSERVP